MNAAGYETGEDNLHGNRWRRRGANADSLQECMSLRLGAFDRVEINARSFRGTRPESDMMETSPIGIG